MCELPPAIVTTANNWHLNVMHSLAQLATHTGDASSHACHLCLPLLEQGTIIDHLQCVCVCVCALACVYVCMCVCVRAYMCACVLLWARVLMHVCMFRLKYPSAIYSKVHERVLSLDCTGTQIAVRQLNKNTPWRHSTQKGWT